MILQNKETGQIIQVDYNVSWTEPIYCGIFNKTKNCFEMGRVVLNDNWIKIKKGLAFDC